MSVARSASAGRSRPTMSEILGLREARSEADLARAIEQRIPLTSVDQLLSVGLTAAELDRLVVSRRALLHRRQRNQPLTVPESDRLVRLARVLMQAIETFGGEERALEWLRTPRQRFDQRAPLDLLISDTGTRMVEDYLRQIDEGYFVGWKPGDCPASLIWQAEVGG